MQRDRDFAGFMGQTLDLVGRNIPVVFLYIVVIGGLNAFGLMAGLIDSTDTIAGAGMGFSVDATDSLTSAAFELGVAILSIIAGYFVLSKLLESAGRLKATDTRIWAYIGMSILSMIGIVLGLILIIVPGLILLVRWSAASGFLIGGRRGITESLGASWEATRGYSWSIFFAALVLFLGLIIIAGAFGAMLAFTGIDLMIALGSSIGEAAGNVLAFAFGIGVYTLVADDSTETADVFA